MRAAARAEEEEASISFVQVYSTLTSLSLSLYLYLTRTEKASFHAVVALGDLWRARSPGASKEVLCALLI